MTEPAIVLSEVAKLLTKGDKTKASDLIEKNYPFEDWKKPISKKRANEGMKSVPMTVDAPEARKYTQKESLKVFSEDGYVDRYSGEKLITPSALYAIFYSLPEVFPWDGARSRSHQGLWDLFPTIDHVHPVSLGGEDVRENWVTTSMTLNMRKSNESMSDLGWSIHDEGDFQDWDGLVSWYVSYCALHSGTDKVRNNTGWHKATLDLYG